MAVLRAAGSDGSSKALDAHKVLLTRRRARRAHESIGGNGIARHGPVGARELRDAPRDDAPRRRAAPELTVAEARATGVQHAGLRGDDDAGSSPGALAACGAADDDAQLRWRYDAMSRRFGTSRPRPTTTPTPTTDAADAADAAAAYTYTHVQLQVAIESCDYLEVRSGAVRGTTTREPRPTTTPSPAYLIGPPATFRRLLPRCCAFFI